MKLFKSAWFKCITTLLLIILISGVGIAVLSFLWEVSPEERTGRALQKIYGRQVSASEYVIDFDRETMPDEDGKYSYDFGVIDKIFIVGKDDTDMTVDTNYDMLFKTTGNEGYKGGTVTMWIKVTINGADKNVDKVIIDSYDKQTLMSQLGASYINGFLIDISNNYDTYFYSKDNKEVANEKINPVTGATKSAQAGCNAVNCVIEFMKGVN